MGELGYQEQYYQDHRSELLAKRKKRYAEDPEYREKVKSRARQAHREKYKSVGEGTFFSVKELAKMIDRSPVTIRYYHKKTIFPETQTKHARGWRLYTRAQVLLCKKVFKALDDRENAKIRTMADVRQAIHAGWEEAGNVKS